MSKRTLYLHVGMDKTGTSAVQYFMHKNRGKLLRDADLCYPSTGLWQDYSHHQFAFTALGLHGYSKNNLRQLFQTLIAEMGDTENVLLSSECLFKIPIKDGFNELCDLIKEFFDGFKLIVYVRRQDEWVESRHKHSIISGKELSLDMLMKPFFCNYKLIIDHWANEFGKENIIVRPYEKQQFVEGSIFSDFLSIFNLKLHDGDYEIPDKGLNVSLGHDCTDFKNICNKIGFLSTGVDMLNVVLLDYQSQIAAGDVSKYILSPIERIKLVKKYSETNKSIATDYLDRADGKLFYDELPKHDEAWEKYSGINKATIQDLSRYISKRNKALLLMIKLKLKKASKSADVEIVEASKLLNGL